MVNTVFSDDEITALFPDLPDGRGLIGKYIRDDQSGKTSALMCADRILYLPDDILVKVDRMSMKSSLGVRAPYLDPEILAFSERIPLAMKIRGRSLKYLLKKVALRYLPPEIVYRPKHGFMVPMARWIKEAGEEDVVKRVPAGTNSLILEQLIRSHVNGRHDNSHKIFALIMLGRYLGR